MLLPTLEPRAQYAASTVSQTAMATSTRKVGVEKETSDSRNWPWVTFMVMVDCCCHCIVSSPYLEQQVGAKQREEDDGGAAEEDELQHGDQQPRHHQAPAQTHIIDNSKDIPTISRDKPK